VTVFFKLEVSEPDFDNEMPNVRKGPNSVIAALRTSPVPG
jgi:hypothetical protein